MFHAPPSRSSTVAEFAAELRKSADSLLEQLRTAGVEKASADDTIGDSDKQQLLEYLQRAQGTSDARERITLGKAESSAARTRKFDETNKVILIGNLGSAKLVGFGGGGSAVLQALAEVANIFYAQDVEPARDAWRRLREALKKLRTCKSIQRVHFNALEPILCPTRSPRRTCAFFHALKVDARNLP